MQRLSKRLKQLILLPLVVTLLSNCEDIGASSKDPIAGTLQAEDVQSGDIQIIATEDNGLEDFLTDANDIDTTDSTTSLVLTAELSNSLWSAIQLGFESIRIILASGENVDCIGEVDATSIFIGFCSLELTTEAGADVTIFIEADLLVDDVTNSNLRTVTTTGSTWFGFEDDGDYAVIGLAELSVIQTVDDTDDTYTEDWSAKVLAILKEGDEIAQGWITLGTDASLTGTTTEDGDVVISTGILTMTSEVTSTFEYDYSEDDPVWD